jgi:biopolymer transport protein ExbB
MDLEQRLLDFSLLGAGWVLWTLVALSAACVVVAVERAAYFRLNKTEDAAMEAAMASFLKNGDTAEFQSALDALGGIQARVLAAGLDASRDGPESVEEVIAGTLVFEKSRAERGLLVLGTVGSNAPFIGLFGTVLGIIKAFHDLAAAQSEATEAVMAGISEALVATAIGLMVAIPAVILYNTFQGKVKSAMSKSQSLSHLVLAKLKSAQSEAS